jgi:AcrR family transcriptional regulator
MYQQIISMQKRVDVVTTGTGHTREKQTSAAAPDTPKQRRTQEERRAETRARLIDATILLLHKKGAAKMTTVEVAEAAGVTRGAIQYHFASPQELLKATVHEVSDRLSKHMDVGALKRRPLPDRIDQVVDQYWKGFGSNTYTAFVEMAVGNRLDRELGAAIREALVELESKRSSMWLDIFADSPRSEEDILVWRSTLLAALRGLSLTKMMSGSDRAGEPQINQFKDMFRLYLSGSSQTE